MRWDKKRKAWMESKATLDKKKIMVFAMLLLTVVFAVGFTSTQIDLTTTYTVNSTVITPTSRIFLQVISDNTGIPSAPTCSQLAVTAQPMPSGRSTGVSFTFSLPSTTGSTCFNYWIIN